MKYLFIFNDPPYGSERTYNGLRLANSLAKKEGTEIRVFLMGDSVVSAKSGQKVPSGYYNAEVMVKALHRRGLPVGLCGTCMDARGMADAELAEGSRRSSLEELTDWTEWADKVIVF